MEMLEFFEGGIVVCRQHFAVSVDVHALSFGLDQEFFKVLQIVSGDQDAGLCAYADVYMSRFRISIGAGMGFIELGHHFHGVFPGFQHHRDQIVCTEAIVDGGREGFHYKFVYFIILEAQHGGMIAIGTHAFEADGNGFTQTADIFILCLQHAYLGGKICILIF